MNQHDDGPGQDHGWVDPAEAGLLKRTFSAMAGGVDPASPTGPAAALAAMSRRVRWRRTAKLGGIGGGALALAGVLVLGAAQLAPPEQAELLPGASSAAPDFELQDGYQPPWLDWSDLTCGMPVADLESTAPGWSVAAAGDVYARTADLGDRPSTSWRMAAAIQEGQGVLDSSLALVWSQDGSVVDLGPDVFGAPGEPDPEPLIGSDPKGVLEAQGAEASTCAPTGTGTNPVFETPLPAGDYEVRVVAFPETAAGRHTTVVSEPVAVHVDADGAHSPLGARGGESAIEPPQPADGELARFELDRTTDWVTASMTQRGRAPAPPVSVTAQCESSNLMDAVRFEVVLQLTGQAIRSGEVLCDGTETVLPVGALGTSAGTFDIRVPREQRVPDGVARFWAVLAPSPEGGGTSGDCSEAGFMAVGDEPSLPDAAAEETATAILEAVRGCDSGRLIELATVSGTELMVPAEAPEVTFALPQTAARPYSTLSALLSDTTAGVRAEQEVEGGPVSETYVWPRVVLPEFADSNEAWQEVVDAGLLTAEEAEAQRADETFGYKGMVLTIAEDGAWTGYSAVGTFPLP